MNTAQESQKIDFTRFPRLVLAKGREKSLLRRHPWVFSGAVARLEGKASAGETVDIVDHQGKWLARGALSPASQIRARVWTFDREETVDIAFFTRRLQQAQQWRDWLAERDGLDSYRLIAGESDGMPGVTIDRFGNFLVLQLLSAGAEYQRPALVSALQALYPDCSIYDRSDVAVRKKEGLELAQGPVSGDLPPALLPIEEHGMKLLVDIQNGHKTGYYLDQRDSRFATRRYVAQKRVLNCFSYTGGFAVSALMGGCSQVISVDTSQDALDVARQNVELNGLDLSKAEFQRDDVFKLLRKYRDGGEKFDVIVMDPPKFVENKSQLMGACRGYKDINMLAIQLLNPGGVLLTFSCSGLMTTDLFQKIIADAATDAGRDVQFIEQFRQAADHPVLASYPEGLYLKGFACRVM
ncbi:23S rRNA (cytosine(1962)-C(5))-methyltransferase RlmI [Franconibacter helveticus 513]|uniref:23S rRNA (cytosine(1962)-C(5))-methyltransferase RlmI n=1 Tax=Franconibacter helveticus TaxID=357240 RepID=UPI00068747B2|nr:23S rRNA (cytosine(1962)-C(5))-methyltransferase RlmI [Franconibacter helveticus]